MKITALRLHNVKRFARRGVAIEGIGDGVNVLCAANEFGKSTSFEALQALFFQPHTGVPKDIRRLQPYSGGHPLVEADIVMPEGRFRLTKQFIGGRRAIVRDLGTGRLVAQQDEAEAFIAAIVRGGAAGPAGLLWVRQGATTLEQKAKAEDESLRMRESLLSSVQGEVEAVTGGRRMTQVLEACAAELGLLLTPQGRPRKEGPYAAALETAARLRDEERRLEADVRILRDALDRRAALGRRRGELTRGEDVAARRDAVIAAEKANEQARAHSDALKAGEAQAALARARRAKAAGDLQAYRAALQRAAALADAMAAADEHRAETLSRSAACQGDLDRALAAAEAADAETRAARDLLTRLESARKAREDYAAGDALRQKLATAETLERRLQEGEAALALVALPADALDRLQALDIEIARLRAAEEAGLPSVRIDYGTADSAKILADGAPLNHGEDRSIRDLTRLTVPGIGVLTIRANRPEGAGAALAAAERKYRDLLAALGVEDMAGARRRQGEAEAGARTRDTLRAELKALVPDGLAGLRRDVARLAALPPGDLELKGDPDQARHHLDQADLRLTAARQAERETRPHLTRLQEARIAAETRAAGLQGELTQLDAVLGPAEGRPGQEQALLAALSEQDVAFDAAERRVATLRERAPDLQTAEAALRRARSVEEAAKQEAARLDTEIAELTGTIRARAQEAVEEVWRETVEAREQAEARVRAFEGEVAVLERLRAALQSARSAARDLYLEPVLKELRPMLSMLFDDVSIVFDEQSLLPQAILRDGQEEDIDRLSGGMREQLSILTRLAFARLLARDGRAAPVILDDALVYSDDDRIERMFDALHREARDQQIIVFSCRQRAFARLGGNVLHMREWQPEP